MHVVEGFDFSLQRTNSIMRCISQSTCIELSSTRSTVNSGRQLYVRQHRCRLLGRKAVPRWVIARLLAAVRG